MGLDKYKEKAKRLSRAFSSKENLEKDDKVDIDAVAADATAKKSEELAAADATEQTTDAVADATADVPEATEAAAPVAEADVVEASKKDDIPEPTVDAEAKGEEVTDIKKDVAEEAAPAAAATEAPATEAKAATETAPIEKVEKVIAEKTAEAKEAAVKTAKESKSNLFKKLLGKFKSSSSTTATPAKN
ncbi:hypothetical protein DIURU_003116 [Diutina rugosa]|uniref:Uncharacterized protein n=1 Tax=Diutina rugosa TaxID=5481 RepID=A0A642UPB8_DIURU|nr:uncharacterized protein DIURU_003116 [Diutina rugosa]KAA8901751.1 hypothetical protein DIURU_003116 [Diutina rugosa]